MAKGTATLIGGPFAGKSQAFWGRSVVIPEREEVGLVPNDGPIEFKPMTVHRYDIVEPVPGVFIGSHQSLIGIESLIQEMIRGYCQSLVPRDESKDSEKFMEGFSAAVSIMMSANAYRREAVCDN